jgi:hypothetical protein
MPKRHNPDSRAHLSIRVDEATRRAVHAQAGRHAQSVAAWITDAITQRLARDLGTGFAGVTPIRSDTAPPPLDDHATPPRQHA